MDETPISLANSCSWQGRRFWGKPREKRQIPKVQKIGRSITMIAFYDCRGPLLIQFLPAGKSVNSTIYRKSLMQFLVAIRRKRSKRFQQRWRLHQDNCKVHHSKIMKQFYAKKKIRLESHPSYSPDIAPCDFSFFRFLKKELMAQSFASPKDVMRFAANATRQHSRKYAQHTYE